jgi:hypothetical protein
MYHVPPVQTITWTHCDTHEMGSNIPTDEKNGIDTFQIHVDTIDITPICLF